MEYIPSTSVYISHFAPSAAASATAEVSEPPLPSVATSPFSLTPWNPATITILPSFRCFFIFSPFISSILFFVWCPPVLIPACLPVREIAGYPNDCKAILKRAIVCCSPVDISLSISLLSGFSVISFASFIRPSVVFPIADTTATTSLPSSFTFPRYLAISNIFSVVATELPPYLWTIITFNPTFHNSEKLYISILKQFPNFIL